MGYLIYNFFLLLYSIAFRIAALFNQKARLGLQGRKQPFTLPADKKGRPEKPLVWMHCASLGEFEQGRPLLELLKKENPQLSIVLTFFSASGFEAMKNYQGADQVMYLPMDSRVNARKMVSTLNPSLVIWVKYEFWYHFLHELKQRNIPVLLVSGIFRESQPFFKWYGRIWKNMLQCFYQLFVQNETSVSLLKKADKRLKVTVTGDTRFDRVIEIAEKFEPLPLIEKFCKNYPIMVAGSTWEADEAELVHFTKSHPQTRFIIAPHEIDADNLRGLKKTFGQAIFYSEWAKLASQPDPIPSIAENKLNHGQDENIPNVLIIDNVGMLSRLYHYADITYIGGGFGAEGVHNVLEAAVYGKPVVFGPIFEKFAEAVELINCGGGIPFNNALELEALLNELWTNNALLAEKGSAAKNFVYANAGASRKIVDFIQENRLLTS